MANNRRNYGGGYSGGSGFNARSGVNPWQSGSSPGRGAPSLLNTSLLSQLTSPDSQLALATKLLSSILPVQQGQPPSLMSLGGGYGGQRYGSGYGGDRFRRDDRRSGDGFRNRRQANDRNRDRKSSDKGRFEKAKKPEDEADGSEAVSNEVKGEGMDEEESAEQTQNEEKREGPLPGYENIPTKLLQCHVCGKSMWNDVSFDTHVKGRNHRNKMRDLEESYQIQTDLMRQIAAISLKLEEIRRGKRRPYPEQYCKMCDLHFNGMTMFYHRSTEEHQSLKRFIHPSCELCGADFQMRLEYDEHLLTPEHLQEEAKADARREKYEKDPKCVSLREQEAKFRLLLDEVADLGGREDLSEEDRKLLEALGEEGQVPAFDADKEVCVARHQVTPAQGFLCKVCRVFLLSDEAAEVHCKTRQHYNTYVTQLKNEATKREKEREKEASDEKRKPDSSEEDGAAKRRKTDSEMEGDTEVNGDSAVVTGAMEVDVKEEEEPDVPEEAAKEPAKSTPRRGRAARGRK